jgi:hypothetical protein
MNSYRQTDIAEILRQTDAAEVEYRARQLQAEAFAAYLRGAARGLRRLARRPRASV